ncbi:MAG: hypothetical protein R3E10_02670 [Gemmatimonadota bacterium]
MSRLPDRQTVRAHRHLASNRSRPKEVDAPTAPFCPDPDTRYTFVATARIDALRVEPGDVLSVVLRNRSPVVVSIPFGPEAIGAIAWNQDRLRLHSAHGDDSERPAADWRPDLRLV